MSQDLPARISEDLLVTDALADAVTSYDQSLKNDYDEARIKQLKVIGAFIMNSLQRDEACLMAHMDPRDLDALMESDPNVRIFIIRKELSYKAALLRTITQKAMDGNDKNAGWLLERRYAREFNAKPAEPEDALKAGLLAEGLAYVREHGDSEPLVPSDTPQITPSHVVTPA